jgi:hypothetical protein
MAFVTSPPLAQRAPAALGAPRMAAAGPPARPALSRRALLAGLGAAVAAAGVTGGAVPANAGLEYNLSKIFFPKEGFTSPEMTTPGSVAVDKSVLASTEGKASLAKIKVVSDLVKQAGREFEEKPEEFDVSAAFKSVRVDELRGALNVVDQAFDEETQKKTDKVVRGILQDIGELVFNGQIKGGAKRTPKKIDRIRAWITKIDGDLEFLLAFYV